MLRARFVSIIGVIIFCHAAAAATADATGSGSTLKLEIECELDINGGISGELKVSATGRAGELLRKWLLNLPAAERQSAAGYFLEMVVSGADVLSCNSQYTGQPSESVVVSCKFRAGIFAAFSRDIIQIPTLLTGVQLQIDSLNSLIEIEKFGVDTAPADVSAPVGIFFNEKIALPEGYSLHGDGSSADLGSGPVRLRGALAAELDSVSRILELEIDTLTVQEKDFEAARKVIDEFLRWRTDAVAVRGGQ